MYLFKVKMHNVLMLSMYCALLLVLIQINNVYAVNDAAVMALEFNYNNVTAGQIASLKEIIRADIQLIRAILQNGRALHAADMCDNTPIENKFEPYRQAFDEISEHMQGDNNDEDNSMYAEHLTADLHMLNGLVAQLQAIEVREGKAASEYAQQVIQGFDQHIQAKLLCDAIKELDYSAVLWLIKNGIAVNACADEALGFTPLMHAVRSGRHEIVMELLYAGAQVETTNALQHTALECVVDSPLFKAALAMQQGGDNPGIAIARESELNSMMQQIFIHDSNQVTPQMIIDSYRFIIRILIRHNAPVIVVDGQGREKNIIDCTDVETQRVMREELESRKRKSSEDEKDPREDDDQEMDALPELSADSLCPLS